MEATKSVPIGAKTIKSEKKPLNIPSVQSGQNKTTTDSPLKQVKPSSNMKSLEQKVKVERQEGPRGVTSTQAPASSKSKFSFKLQIPENGLKKPKLEPVKPVRPVPAKMVAEINSFIRAEQERDKQLDEEFWRKLAAEEERRQRMFQPSPPRRKYRFTIPKKESTESGGQKRD